MQPPVKSGTLTEGLDEDISVARGGRITSTVIIDNNPTLGPAQRLHGGAPSPLHSSSLARP